jgi:restriction endonuclease S subunit
MTKKALNTIADLRFGLYAQAEPSGSAYYLQVRHFTETGRLITEPDEYVTIYKDNISHILQDGDVLLVGKGHRLFSWCYKEMERPAVASSIFFVLRPDATIICPEYLTAILNAPQTKKTFLQIGSGTNIFSIRKSELGAFEIPLPAMSEQKKIAALAELHQQEVALAQKVIEQKQNFYASVIAKLIK